ncbi:MAG: hypothetical protein GXP32_04845 [Kiritimatiellaeota bacterium]|nr:hypothetical protein [Kiritimatiellota bacterium]
MRVSSHIKIVFLSTVFAAAGLTLFADPPASAETRGKHPAADGTKKTTKVFPPTSASSEKRLKVDTTPSPQRTGDGARRTVLDGKKLDSETRLGFRKDLLLRINEIIMKVERNSAVLASELSDDLKISLLKRFASELGDGVEYIPALEFKQSKKKSMAKHSSSYRRAIIINSGKVLYLRINRFDEKTLKGLLEDNANLAERPLGLIIDLRSAGGSNCLIADKAAALFISSSEKKGKRNASSGVKKNAFGLPVIMLMDGDTSGAAEVFAALIVKAGRGVCLGEASAGRPFAKQRFSLANGDYLLIPQVPGKFKQFSRSGLKPDIQFPAKPQISYEKLKSGGENKSDDKCVARAVDLLICLNAISTRKRNPEKE